MGAINRAKEILEKAETEFSTAKAQTHDGKDQIESVGPSFHTMREAKTSALDITMGMLGKLLEVRGSLKDLADIADRGKGVAQELREGAKTAEDNFRWAQTDAGMGGFEMAKLDENWPHSQQPEYAKEAGEKLGNAGLMARHLALEGAVTEDVFASFTGETAASLQAALEHITTTLEKFASGPNGLSGISNVFLLRNNPEEKRTTEYVSGQAGEAITALEVALIDIDRHSDI